MAGKVPYRPTIAGKVMPVSAYRSSFRSHGMNVHGAIVDSVEPADIHRAKNTAQSAENGCVLHGLDGGQLRCPLHADRIAAMVFSIHRAKDTIDATESSWTCGDEPWMFSGSHCQGFGAR